MNLSNRLGRKEYCPATGHGRNSAFGRLSTNSWHINLALIVSSSQANLVTCNDIFQPSPHDSFVNGGNLEHPPQADGALFQSLLKVIAKHLRLFGGSAKNVSASRFMKFTRKPCTMRSVCVWEDVVEKRKKKDRHKRSDIQSRVQVYRRLMMK